MVDLWLIYVFNHLHNTSFYKLMSVKSRFKHSGTKSVIVILVQDLFSHTLFTATERVKIEFCQTKLATQTVHCFLFTFICNYTQSMRKVNRNSLETQTGKG